jgi:[ribosomal protein S18]-alanine N-acetyltransferase
MNALLHPRALRRAMTVRDVDRVAAVEQVAYAFPWSRGNFVDSLAAGYLAEVLQSTNDGELLGHFVAMPGVDELHLLNVTVARAWQGRGLGSELLDAVQAHAASRGLAQLWLEVRAGNHRARALYRRRGFAEVGLRRGYYPAAAGREDAVIMSLTVGARDAVD